MSTFVLIHGACQGGWCWYKIVPRLARAGHKVEAPDLPSPGRGNTPISEITLDSWTETVCHVLDAQEEPVILLGHSRGGIVISQAAEKRPEKVKTLVYLTAFLLRSGESLLQVAQGDGTSMVLPNLIPATDQSYATFNPGAIKEVLCGDCSDEDVALTRLLLVPEVLGPSTTPISITETNFGQVSRIYIECLRDKAVPPSLQRKMYAALPCQKVISMNTDHSPFFSAPDELTTCLLSL